MSHLELQEKEKIPEFETEKRALNKIYEIIYESIEKAKFNYQVKVEN